MSNSLRVVSNQLSKLGKAMLIPVVAMPVAGLLSRLGQPDLLNLDILKIASDVIFGNLDLLFAVGCILAYTKAKINHLQFWPECFQLWYLGKRLHT